MRRRTLLLAGTAGASALVVGWMAAPQRSRLGSPRLLTAADGEVALNGWIKIAADGGVVLAMPRSEMGQGVHTALAMLAAEELDVPLAAVLIEQAGSDKIYGNVAYSVLNLPFHPLDVEREDGFGRVKASRWVVGKVAREIGINATGGSSSVADAWPVVRMAAATARASLLGAASLHWRLPVDELTVRQGVISHPSGKSARYAEMARFAAATPAGRVQVKERAAWTLIGRPAPRLDVPAKVDGSAVFGLDVRVPGMKFAAVRLCPVIGGSPGRIDASRALALPGVERLVMLPAYGGSTAGFAVIGRTTWHARQGAAAVDVEWQGRPAGSLDSRSIERALRNAVETQAGFTFHETGDVAEVEGRAKRTVEAWYGAPYLAHASLEPMNCTARVADRRVELWAPTQVPQLCRAAAAMVAGVELEDVTLHVTLLGGGFGRRLEVDYAAQATRVAMDVPGTAVQLSWSREEDTTHDFYRPMQVARLRGTLDDEGQALSLRIQSAGDAISPRWFERVLPAGLRATLSGLQLTAPALPGVSSLSGPLDRPDKTAAEGLFNLPYGIAHQRMDHVATRSGVPVGFWRSVGHSHNAFFAESFIDEMAHAAGADPVAFRRRLLRNAPRYQAVLDLAAAKAGWGSGLPQGRARGIALHESFGSIVAQVAEVSIEQGLPRVHRVVCAIDCGTVVNPQILAQQMEGAVAFALSAALYGRIDVRGGAVQQRNFPDQPLVSLKHSPRVETWIVPSEREPAGVGEPGVPPLAPAVANAVFALTHRRLRQLPLALDTDA
ncbi:xanthine dehydrogenase family protein molybdopterin-binding subunit [Ramlibacter henchirensis]|uniref:Xanthine dehydrogenase family protein molybdopterin-binding subunit n=1 Tax=Ramlibacter henchirensis TaxID=204072 RepID=A0A4Z0C743_9BURK|nr:molybdopterin cofactor-binding domain-containing protein [Ramlibacter henchirensis]TFZ07101.1 xanthine dehydrogenase family protein molybdopterin-binding subunit [Ramlibacter henchirensis]